MSWFPIPRTLRALTGVATIAMLAGAAGLPTAAAGERMGWPLAGGPTTRRPVPDLEFDVEHYAIRLDFDLAERMILGDVELSGKAVRDRLPRIALHAVGMEILGVTDAAGDSVRWGYDGTELRLLPARPLAHGEAASFRVRYRCRPARGAYFVSPATAPDLPDRHEVWTQGEDEDTRHWLPCWDYPNDKATSEITLIIPAGWKTLSNGRLLSSGPGPRPGTVSHHWREEIPHVAYLTSFVAGNYEQREEASGGVPLVYLYPPGEWERAQRVFRRTGDMLRFFGERTGVAYPYPQYGQATVTGLFAAMENVGATTFETRYALLDTTAYPTRRVDQTTAHEAAHQWFGDLLTCRDWSHAWLNEGFATYFDALYWEELQGSDELVVRMRANRSEYLDEFDDDYRRPIVDPVYTDPADVFDSHTYDKGSWVLHMLRDELRDQASDRDDAFWRGIRLYVSRHARQTVRTEDLRRALEDASGVELGWFFDQWLHRAGHPELEIASRWLERDTSLEVRIAQRQPVDSLTPLFRFPVVLEIGDSLGVRRERFTMERAEETYRLRQAAPPLWMRFDPDQRLLKTVTWDRPTEWLVAQLVAARDAEGRLDACEALAKKTNEPPAVAALARVLGGDSFYAVRAEAAKSLGKLASQDALAALAPGEKDPDPRVRAAVAAGLKSFVGDKRAARLAESLTRDFNGDVTARALSSLCQIDAVAARPVLERSLRRASYRSTVADTALRGLGALGDARLRPLLERHLDPAHGPFARSGAAVALGRLGGQLSATSTQERAAIRRRLLRLLEERNDRRVRLAAIEGLGLLGDAEAVPVLARLRDGATGAVPLAARERVEADRALRRIRDRSPTGPPVAQGAR